MMILADHLISDTNVRYHLGPETGAVRLVIVPTATHSKLCDPRAGLSGTACIDQLDGGDKIPARVVDFAGAVALLEHQP